MLYRQIGLCCLLLFQSQAMLAVAQSLPELLPLPDVDVVAADPSDLPAGGDPAVEPPNLESTDVAGDGVETLDVESIDELKFEEPAHWYQPGYWLRPTPWDGGVELGISGAEGNSQTFNIATGANAKLTTERGVLALDLNYAKTTANSVETQNNAYLKGRYDWSLGETAHWTLFTRGTLEYDEFRAFDLRLAANMGLGYQLIHTESATLSARFGGGVSHELGGPDDAYVPEGLYGLDVKYQLTAKQKISGTADYYPSWNDYSGEYRVETRVSWEVLLDEATNLSLKISAIDRYDNTPNGRKPNDFDYTLVLLWKL
ncbi:MAG: YdiY family protein [Pirellulales bacterium]